MTKTVAIWILGVGLLVAVWNDLIVRADLTFYKGAFHHCLNNPVRKMP